ncbi:acyltransferase family protein [Tardiphaga sp. 768_D3_N2_1]|uniref:acyltransferase family protein n=1 Tax=Tardiphaga sp. 768_D3_N2_1 TaxID=3240783 RepID=UPI003F8A6CB5
MGTLRFALAVVVALSHAGAVFWGYNTGVVAVVSFFMISGYVMALVIKTNYNSLDRVGHFYLDRAARILPQFWGYCILAGLFLWLSGYRDVFSNGCGSGRVALNVLAIPLNFFQFGNLESCLLIPPAWSLGLEVTFYLVAPFLILSPKTMWMALLASLLVFAVAYTGAINSDMFGYRLLPGVLFIFLTGTAFAGHDRLSNYAPFAIWTLAAVTATFFPPSETSSPMIKEVLLGVVLAVPALALTRRLPRFEFDHSLGNLSYGVFLSHFLVIWILRYFKIETSSALFWIFLFASSISMSAVSFRLLEKRAIDWRRQMRRIDGGQSKASRSVHASREYPLPHLSLPRRSIQPNVTR